MSRLVVEALRLQDVKLIRPPKFGDERGFFSELYSQRSLAEHGIRDLFVQDNCSLSAEPGTIIMPAEVATRISLLTRDPNCSANCCASPPPQLMPMTST